MHTSGPKGRDDSIPLIPGINPRPTARRSLSAACETPASLRLGLVGGFTNPEAAMNGA